MSDLGNLLADAVRGPYAAAQKGTHGYVAGGYDATVPGYIDTIQQLTFPGDSMATLVPTLPAATGFGASFACDSGL